MVQLRFVHSRDQHFLKESHTMSTIETAPPLSAPNWQSLRFRLLGLLPLFFFFARVFEYAYRAKTPEQILWSCHISNLLLAIGMFIASPLLIRITTFWLILGEPP